MEFGYPWRTVFASLRNKCFATRHGVRPSVADGVGLTEKKMRCCYSPFK
jgi:hypothetical protein